VALVACGTRTIIDAVFGPMSCGELDCTRRLRRSLHAAMIVLADRNFDAAALIGQLAATEAHLLVRLKGNRKLPVLRRCHDGSFLSQIGAVRVRVIECQITIASSAGRHTGSCRLATTLLDPRRYPAAGLISLYHQGWEIETAYLELKSSVLGGRVLRARTPHRQTHDLRIPGQRPQHQPAQLQGHPRNQHPCRARTLTRPTRGLTTWPCG
jgi:hypothetical protein